METRARSRIRDQNLSVHLDAAPLGVKTNVSKSQKDGGGLGGGKTLRGRKALNDISNLGRPSALNSSKTHISKNVIEIGSSKPISSFGSKRKGNVSKAPEKVQAGGRRKALSDLTNSGKPYVRQSSNDSRGKKLGAVMEEPDNISGGEHNNDEECIKVQQWWREEPLEVHNHQECCSIEAQQLASSQGDAVSILLSLKFKEEEDSLRDLKTEEEILSLSPPRCYLEYLGRRKAEMSENSSPRYRYPWERSPKSPEPPCEMPMPSIWEEEGDWSTLETLILEDLSIWREENWSTFETLILEDLFGKT